MSSNFVQLEAKYHRGWPWPEDSYGLTPMFGEDGWCHDCGVPNREQTGSMFLQRRGVIVKGAWMPNWQFHEICVALDVANEIQARFNVEMREIKWPKTSPGEAMQLIVPVTKKNWFDAGLLSEMARKRHGEAGSECGTCGVWRYYPLMWGSLPPFEAHDELEGFDIVASPEWFGDGWSASRQLLVRRELAELLVASNPRGLFLDEPVELTGVAGSAPHWSDRLDASGSDTVGSPEVSEIFVAEFLPESVVIGSPNEQARGAAVRARKLLEGSKGLVSADALTSIAQTLFDGGEVEEAMSLWKQAAERGSAAARIALDSHRGSGNQRDS